MFNPLVKIVNKLYTYNLYTGIRNQPSLFIITCQLFPGNYLIKKYKIIILFCRLLLANEVLLIIIM